jgi:hypothetical protein
MTPSCKQLILLQNLNTHVPTKNKHIKNSGGQHKTFENQAAADMYKQPDWKKQLSISNNL